MWNIALDGEGNPKLPGTTSCGGPGCRPIAQIDSDGTYFLHQECKSPSYHNGVIFKHRQKSTPLHKLPKQSYPKTLADLGVKELESP